MSNSWLSALEKVLAAMPDHLPSPPDAFIMLLEAQANLEVVDQTIEHFTCGNSKEVLDPSEEAILRSSRRDLAIKTAVRAMALWQALSEQETKQ